MNKRRGLRKYDVVSVISIYVETISEKLVHVIDRRLKMIEEGDKLFWQWHYCNQFIFIWKRINKENTIIII